MSLIRSISQLQNDLRHQLLESQRLFGCKGVFLSPAEDHIANPPLIWLNCKTAEDMHTDRMAYNIMTNVGYVHYVLCISINIIGSNNDNIVFNIGAFVEGVMQMSNLSYSQQYQVCGLCLNCAQVHNMNNRIMSHLMCISLDYNIAIRLPLKL